MEGKKDIAIVTPKSEPRIHSNKLEFPAKVATTPMRTRTSTGARQRVSFKDLSNTNQQQNGNPPSPQKIVTRSRRGQKRDITAISDVPLVPEKVAAIPMAKRTRKAKVKPVSVVEIEKVLEETPILEDRLEQVNTEKSSIVEKDVTSENMMVVVEILPQEDMDMKIRTDVDKKIVINPHIDETVSDMKKEPDEPADELPVPTAEMDVAIIVKNTEPCLSSLSPPVLIPETVLNHLSSSLDDVNDVAEGDDEGENLKLLETLPKIPTDTVKPKRKKNKGRNGNIYIGVANRIEWFRLQEKFGFDNVNAFGTFVMDYMNRVYEDFDMLHQVALESDLYAEHGLHGFTWVNGLPHPSDKSGKQVQLPELKATDDLTHRLFEMSYDLAIQRGRFLIDLSKKEGQQEQRQSCPSQEKSAFSCMEVVEDILALQGKMKQLEELGNQENPEVISSISMVSETEVEMEAAQLRSKREYEMEDIQILPISNAPVVATTTALQQDVDVYKLMAKRDVDCTANEVKGPDGVVHVAPDTVELKKLRA